MLVILWKINVDLATLGFCLLEAQNIRIVFGDEGLQCAFAQYSADAVDVPGIQFHFL